MARRKSRTTTRDRILDAAAKIVTQHGVGAATTKLIAAKAGVSEGSLYNHFADKPELLTTLVLERLPSIRAAFVALHEAAEAGRLHDKLPDVLAAMIAFYTQAQPIVGGIAADPKLLQLCRRRFAKTDEGPHRAHEKLAAFLKREQQNGRLSRAASADVLASVLIGACSEYASVTNLTGKRPGNLSSKAYATAVVATLSPLLFAAPPRG